MIPNNIQYEYELMKKGITFVAGVDEVGRGPLAGPNVFSAVVVDVPKMVTIFEKLSENNDVGSLWYRVTDSKLISEQKRPEYAEFLKERVVEFKLIEYSAHEIDIEGIGPLTQRGFYESISGLNTSPEHILADGFAIKRFTREHQTPLIKGDQKSLTIAAASIIAKVYRDELMVQYHHTYPGYGFDKHKGYGTKAHLQALESRGPCPIHRRSFSPIAVDTGNL